MRKSDLFLIYLALNLILFAFLFTHASLEKKAGAKFIAEKMEMVHRLGLTDLCLFTEASYTRHLSQADLHTPFQDSPISMDHFPSGSFIGPSQKVRELNDKLD